MKLPFSLQWAFLALLTTPSATAFMRMKTMLMGDNLEHFLSDLVSFGDISEGQKSDILDISATGDSSHVSNGYNGDGLFGGVSHPFPNEGGVLQDDSSNNHHRADVDAFASQESKEELRSYLLSQLSLNEMSEEAAEIIASTLSLGALFPSTAAMAAESVAWNGPVEKGYTGDGNLMTLGRWNELAVSTYSGYNGIWGYATGDREYALQCHGEGFNIIDITDPASPFRVQFVAMEGGGYWRDVATHYDENSGKTYAYVGAQGTQGGGTNPNLFVFDLSHLSGDINNPHSPDENPIPAGSNGYLDLGETDHTHTLNVDRGLLFLNTAYSSRGCRVYDLTVNPMSPKYLFNTAGSGKSCHDSSVMKDVDGRDFLVVSDGGGRRQRIYDITNVNPSSTTAPPLFGQTPDISGIYAHSNWATEDHRYLFSFDENNEIDISVHDISDPENPVQIALFQYSGDSSGNALPHNGQVIGNSYLLVAYYEAGAIMFDISNPYAPFEIGRIRTYTGPIKSTYEGAWNTYPYLPSGNILVSDISQGLFVLRASAPYSAPSAPVVTIDRAESSGDVTLRWDAVDNARGYSVEYSSSPGGTFTMIAEHLTGTTFVHTSASSNPSYKVSAVNGEGVGSSVVSVVEAPSASPSKSNQPTESLAPSGASSSSPSSGPSILPSLAPTNYPIVFKYLCGKNDSPSTICATGGTVDSTCPTENSFDKCGGKGVQCQWARCTDGPPSPSGSPSPGPPGGVCNASTCTSCPGKGDCEAADCNWYRGNCVNALSGTKINLSENTSDVESKDLKLTGTKPMAVCEGHCRRNSDCAQGLSCFRRQKFEPVPGCTGEGIKKKNYCYDPAA